MKAARVKVWAVLQAGGAGSGRGTRERGPAGGAPARGHAARFGRPPPGAPACAATGECRCSLYPGTNFNSMITPICLGLPAQHQKTCAYAQYPRLTIITLHPGEGAR